MQTRGEQSQGALLVFTHLGSAGVALESWGLGYKARVGQSWSRSSFWHTIRSKFEFGLDLGPPRSWFGLVLTSVSLDHGYAYLKRDKYINVY